MPPRGHFIIPSEMKRYAPIAIAEYAGILMHDAHVIAANFGFRGDASKKKVGVLSGGELLILIVSHDAAFIKGLHIYRSVIIPG